MRYFIGRMTSLRQRLKRGLSWESSKPTNERSLSIGEKNSIKRANYTKAKEIPISVYINISKCIDWLREKCLEH